MAKPHFRTIHLITILAILLSQFSQVGITSVIPVAAADNNFTVNSTVDAQDANPGDGLCETTTPGECTLRAAVQEADAVPGSSTIIELQADTIYTLTTVDAVFTETALAASGDVDITINGHSATIERSTVVGTPAFRIFEVTGVNDTLTLNDLTVRNGSAFQGQGGGLYNDGTAIINNSTFSGNFAANGGGGIYNQQDLTVTNSAFSVNSANIGGGIYNDGNLDVTAIDFSGNAATSGNGGAIANFDTLDVTQSTFSQNSAVKGGAILNWPSATANIVNSDFTDNEALGGVAAPGDGGGIINDGTLTVTGSTFSGNFAGISNGTNGGSGGGIYNTGTLTFTDSELVNNRANFTGGGGFYNTGNLIVANATISANNAEEGGGIYNSGGGVVTVNSTAFWDNGANNGAGIYNVFGTLDVTNSTFFNNVSFFGGGGIFSSGAAITVTNSTFSDNGAEISGSGGIFSVGNMPINLINSLFEGNARGNCGDGGITPSPIIDGGGNLSSDGTCPFSGSSVNNTDPLLGPLQDNGGPTQTMALLGGSPAIDGGNNTNCPPTDQRGIPRPQGPQCDIGAYEAEYNLFLVTNTNDSGAGSLRQAILDANAATNFSGQTDRIHFNIPGAGVHTIQPSSPLPSVDDPVVIDGYTQPGASWNTLAVGNNAVLLIELDGSLTTGMGLVLTAPNSTVRGLVINRFTGGANGLIYIFYSPAADNTIIEGNFLGTNATGTTVFPAQAALYGVIAYSANNRIGTNGDGVNDAGERNLIAGHATAGIVIGNLPAHNNNIVAGNYIGTNAAGTAALSVSVLARGVWANVGDGQRIGTDANGVSDVLERNVISGNPLVGVLLDASSTNNVVAGNYIGTDASGTAELGNGTGVGMTSSNNLIGGSSAGARNLISGNNLNGVLIQGTSAATNTVQGNTISNNGSNGVAIDNNSLGNLIGGNAFSNNGSLGIDLGRDGPTPNDAGDADSGANNFQNYPEITSAAINATGALVVNYSVDSLTTESAYPIIIELFEADNAVSGEGQTFLGRTTLNAPGSSSLDLGFAPDLGVLPGDPIVATATDANDNTSEFSPVTITTGGTLFVVSKTADTNDGTCDADCSLREAITAANAHPNGTALDEILFQIPGTGVQTIQPTSHLPVITDPVIIDGYTQPGASTNTLLIGSDAVLLIELDGTSVVNQPNGLNITTNKSIVRGLVINRFASNGILLSDGANGNVIEGNYIGVNATGDAALGNSRNGVAIGDASGNIIGGTTPQERNLISGNTLDGVFLTGATTTGNVVRGNYIGVAANGDDPMPNHDRGIRIVDGAHNNTIGGPAAGAGNLISGNLQYGLEIAGNETRDNTILGNLIGTNASGTGRIPNATGILIHSQTSDNIVGGTDHDPGICNRACNLISGNLTVGVRISDSGTMDNEILGNFIGTNLSGDGPIAVPNVGTNGILIIAGASGNAVGGVDSDSGNLISGNGVSGVLITGAGTTDNIVQGNKIGTDVTGQKAIPNTNDGVGIANTASGNLIGGTDGRARNIISGNGGGVHIDAAGTTNNLVQGNYIGTNVDGTKEIHNNEMGVFIGSGATNNVVGTNGDGALDSTEGNLISGNGSYGVGISNSPSNVIAGNYIGTNASGNEPLGNGLAGISISANNNRIGTNADGVSDAAERNLISGNKTNGGVWIFGGTGNIIAGNYIGTDVSGMNAMPNTRGVWITNANSSDNVIGGATEVERNLVSGNSGGGVVLSEGTSTNIVQGNYIGTDVTGTQPLGNGNDGIHISTGATGNVIGGSVQGEGNVIAGNGGRGISLFITSNNTIQGNLIGQTSTGLAALGHIEAGIRLDQATGNLIGGTVDGAGNVISGNNGSQAGLWLRDNSDNNMIQGNRIGTDTTGIEAIPNSTGIYVLNSDNNLIGGTETLAGNLISGNAQDGINLAGSVGTQVWGNRIGTNVNGAALGNAFNGITIHSGSTNNNIGGSTLGMGNVIAYNKYAGVNVSNETGQSQNDLITGNSIYANSGLGIDLGGDGQTDNDVGDDDPGANLLQNFSIIAGAIPADGKTKIDGRLDSTPNTVFSLDFYDNATCDPSSYGEGQKYLGSLTVTTDAKGNGYFTDAQGGAFVWPEELPIGHFVTVTATDLLGNTSEFSQCVWVGPDNVNWLSALRLSYDVQGKASAEQFLGKEGEARWYKFPIAPGDKLTITLTRLAANYDITVYKDINAIYQASLSSPEDLELIGAEFADLALSPDRLTPDRLTPDRLTPDRLTPAEFSANVFSPDRLTTDVFSPDRLTWDVIAPDRLTPDRLTPDRLTAEGFSPDRLTPDRLTPLLNAQLRALVAVSAFDGTTSEGIIVNTWTNTGDYYVRVLGRNGAFNTTQPFHFQVDRQAGACANVDFGSLPQTSISGSAGSYQTLILSDFNRMSLTSSEAQALQTKITQLAARPEAAGAWINVGADSRVTAANALADANVLCPYAKNVVAESIKAIIDRYRALNPNLKYIVLLGNDHAIPFFRQPDQSLLGPESQYDPPVRDSSASQASLKLNYVLTQDAYGSQISVSYDSQSLPIPNLAVGRLVETPTEIIQAIDSYLGLNGAALSPKSSLVTGYDFLHDAAKEVKRELDEGTGVTGPKIVTDAYSDKLISDPNLSPLATHETNPDAPLDSLPWTATQLATMMESRRHDLVFLAGHFSARSALAADFTTRYTTDDLIASSADLQNAIVFSAGCHAGYNVVYEDRIPIINVDLDWAQAFTRRGAILIAGTGYQYGDSDFIEYNERLYVEFSKQLRTGSGPVSIGEALVNAKQIYLANTPQMRGIHAKSYLETTLFGLPMIKVDMPGTHILPPPPPAPVTPTLVNSDPGKEIGLHFRDIIDLETPTKIVTRTLKDDTDSTRTINTTYLTGTSSVVTNPAEPILPLQIVDVTGPAGLTLRGVGFMGGSYEDRPDIIPLTGAPAIELRGVHTLFNSPIFYPPRPWSVNYYDALANPNGQVLLNLTPAQFKSDSPESRTGTFRVYENMSFRLFYSGYTGVGSDAAPPAILKVLSHGSGAELSFRITVMGDIAAGVQDVWITYTDISAPNGQWQSFNELTRDPDNPADWIGTLTDLSNPENIRFMVQAVNGVGLVTLSTNLGSYYTPDVDPGAPPPAPPPDAPPLPVTTLDLNTTPAAGNYGGATTATVRLTRTDNGQAVENEIVSLTFGFQSVQLTTNSAGEVTHTFSLNALPGSYIIRASFAGNESYAPAEDKTITFVIGKQPTNLTLAQTINGNVASFSGTLVDSEKNALGQQTVVFVLSRVDGAYTATLAAFTDPSGTAVPDVVSLPAGRYEVTAYFGEQVPNTDIDLTSQLYEASPKEPKVFDVGFVFTSSNQLEDFNQRSAVLSNKWQDRSTGSYRVLNNQLDIIAGGPLYWKDSPFGSNQGVQATFVKVDPNSSRQALLLKVQGSGQPDWQQGAIALVYDGKQHLLRVETYQPNGGQKWTAYSDLALNMHDGDRLGAMIFSDGKVHIFLNGNLIATVTLNQTDQDFFNNRGGYIGLWFTAANEAVLDNFGGGTILP